MKHLFRFSLFILIFSFSTLFAISHTPIAHAQTPQPQLNNINPYGIPNTDPSVPKNLHTLVGSVTLDIYSMMICQLAGFDPLSDKGQCLGFDFKTKKITYMPNNSGGLVGFMGNSIVALYNPTIHTSDMINYAVSGFHNPFGEKSYAANISAGESAIAPLAKLWAASRNLAYGLLVVVFMLTGLFIMLRVKIDPRTVMSVQNRLPNMIIAILLILFSYLIVAAMFDASFVLSAVGLNLIGSATGRTVSYAAATDTFSAANTFNGGVGGGFLAIPWTSADAFKKIVNANISSIPFIGALNWVLAFRPSYMFCQFDPPGWLSWLKPDCGNESGAIGELAGQIAFVVILIAVVVSLFKLWFKLIMCYLTILFNLVLGPIMILAGLIPGSGMNFSSWFKTIAANLLAFPSVLLFLALADAFARAISGTGGTPPPTPPLLGITTGSSASNIGALLMVGAYFMAPGIPDEINKAFKAEQGLAKGLGQGFNTSVGFITGSATKGMRTVFREPDPLRHQSAGIGWQMMGGSDSKLVRWIYKMRGNAYLTSGDEKGFGEYFKGKYYQPENKAGATDQNH
jgi:hypothetical protein